MTRAVDWDVKHQTKKNADAITSSNAAKKTTSTCHDKHCRKENGTAIDYGKYITFFYLLLKPLGQLE